MKRAQSLRTSAPTRPAATVNDAAVRPTRFFRVLAGVSARRLRGLSFLASLSFALAVLPLVAVSLLPWWSVLVAVAALIGDVAWLRHVAVSQRVAGRGLARAGGAAAGRARPDARYADYFQSGSDPLFGAEPDLAVELEPGSDEEDEEDDQVFGAVGSAETTERIEPYVEADPSVWAPVPVPPPTYTLKARAADPVPVPVVVAETTGAENWSLDGLVYDCDLDELVERRSATGA